MQALLFTIRFPVLTGDTPQHLRGGCMKGEGGRERGRMDQQKDEWKESRRAVGLSGGARAAAAGAHL